MFFVFLIIDKIIKNDQNGIAKVNEKIICLDDEKIYGNKPKKLLIKININNVINKNEGDFVFFDLYNINISLFRIIKILFINHLIRFGIIQIKFGINIIVIIVLNQFNSKLKINVEGSKTLNKFVVIFFKKFFFYICFYYFNK